MATIDRLHKFFVDRDDALPADIEVRLQGATLTLECGIQAACSATGQAALLTAVNLLTRIYRAPVTVHMSLQSASTRLVIPPAQGTLCEVLSALSPLARVDTSRASACVFLQLETGSSTLGFTHDGWIVRVGPSQSPNNKAGVEHCALVGVLGGALLVSEAFLQFADVVPEAGRRDIEISLWRPDLPATHGDAQGPRPTYLPSELWILGLGHIGQGALWAFSMLPYERPHDAVLTLHDNDVVSFENLRTQVLTTERDVGHRKTHVAARFLQERGLSCRIIDRWFDHTLRVQNDEPTLAICAFDGGGPRHLLDGAGFQRILVCGVGGTSGDFDHISMTAIPASRTAAQLWPPPTASSGSAEALASTRTFYRQVLSQHKCGHIELAGHSIAVPFVGAIAGALAVTDFVRLAMQAPVLSRLELRLDNPSSRIVAPLVPHMIRPRWQSTPSACAP